MQRQGFRKEQGDIGSVATHEYGFVDLYKYLFFEVITDVIGQRVECWDIINKMPGPRLAEITSACLRLQMDDTTENLQRIYNLIDLTADFTYEFELAGTYDQYGIEVVSREPIFVKLKDHTGWKS